MFFGVCSFVREKAEGYPGGGGDGVPVVALFCFPSIFIHDIFAHAEVLESLCLSDPA